MNMDERQQQSGVIFRGGVLLCLLGLVVGSWAPGPRARRRRAGHLAIVPGPRPRDPPRAFVSCLEREELVPGT